MLVFKKVNTDLDILRLYKYLLPIEDTVLPPVEMFTRECRQGLGMIYMLDKDIIGCILAYPVETGWMEIDQLHIDKEFRDTIVMKKFYLKILALKKRKGLRIRAKITNQGMIDKIGHLLSPLPEKGDNWWEVKLGEKR